MIRDILGNAISRRILQMGWTPQLPLFWYFWVVWKYLKKSKNLLQILEESDCFQLLTFIGLRAGELWIVCWVKAAAAAAACQEPDALGQPPNIQQTWPQFSVFTFSFVYSGKSLRLSNLSSALGLLFWLIDCFRCILSNSHEAPKRKYVDIEISW